MGASEKPKKQSEKALKEAGSDSKREYSISGGVRVWRGQGEE